MVELGDGRAVGDVRRSLSEESIKLDYVAIGKVGPLTSKDQPLPSPDGDAAAVFALWSPRTT